MDPVDEFARLRAEIKRLEAREAVLRSAMLRPGARLRSNLHEVVIKDQVRQTFQKDLLPPEFLQSPRFWKESRCQVVTVRELTDEGPMLRRAVPGSVAIERVQPIERNTHHSQRLACLGLPSTQALP